jgi:hypothetical protein
LTLLSNPIFDTANSSSGVSFSVGANPSDLPQGNNISFVADTSFGADNPAPTNGVQNSEHAAFLFTGNFGDVLTAMQEDPAKLQVGIHVISIDQSRVSSDSYVNTPPPTDPPPPGGDPVPEPATMILMGMGMIGLGFGLRKKKK